VNELRAPDVIFTVDALDETRNEPPMNELQPQDEHQVRRKSKDHMALQGSRSRRQGFIITGSEAGADGTFGTNQPGVYAVGDVRSGSVKRVASAVGEGSVVISDIHRYLAAKDSAASRGQKQTDMGRSLHYTRSLPGPAIGFQTG
jgi:NADPH-dependent glutamate synthase beta subunit-like oxidoreductase